MPNILTDAARRILPQALRRWLVRQSRRPRIGRARPIDLRRLTPISRSWGADRGQPIDRLFIESFLAECSEDIRGRVLEFGNDRYTRQFGAVSVTRGEIADVDSGNPAANLIVDLNTGDGLPRAVYDCIICTQTLQFVSHAGRAIHSLRHALIPGGVLLITVPGISQVISDERNPWPDYWRFTADGLKEILLSSFDPEAVKLNVYGNVFVALAFLHGLAAQELTEEELAFRDPSYPVLVACRAVASQ
jgi:SAM-dependent methyltransferase